MKKHQCGMHITEFAMILPVFLMLFFGVIEFARALFAWNTMVEATRRGARVAVVCPRNDPAIKQVAIFNAPGGSGSSPVLRDLDSGNINVEYFQDDGTAATTYSETKYVRVSIQGYQHRLLIPFLPPAWRTLTMPPSSTTLPAESLGYIPDTGNRDCPAF